MKILTNLLFFLILLFFNIKIKAQYSYKEVIALSKKEIITEKKVDRILACKKKNTLYADIAHSFSFFFYKKKRNYDLAIKYGLIEVKTLDSLQIWNKKHINALYNLGKFHSKKQLLNTSIKFYKRAIQSNKLTLKVGKSYCEAANIYFKKGNYYEAINYFLKGIPLLEKHRSGISLFTHYTRLADNCNKINSKEATELGLFYLKKGDSILQKSEKFKKNKKILYAINTSFANLYSLKHLYSYKKAKYYYNKNFEVAYKYKDSAGISLTSLNIGELYLKRKNDSCLFFLNQSLKHDFGKYISNEAYLNIASYYISKHNYKKALHNINKSLENNFNSKKKLSILSNEELLKSKDQRSLIKALKIKLIILLNIYKRTNNNELLTKAIHTVNFTNKIIKLLINYNSNTDTQFLWRSDVSEVFNLGIRTAYLLNKPELMFQFMEENKAFLLTQNIKKNVTFSNLPEEISVKNNILKKNILTLNSQINIHKVSKKRDSLLNLKIDHENFLDSIHKKYPRLKKQNQNIQILSLRNLKDNLSDKDIVMYYSLHKNDVNSKQGTIFGLLVSKKFDSFFKIKNTPEVLHLLNQYRKLISKPLTKKEELNIFKRISFSLFNYLFPTEKIKNSLIDKNLIIIPDVNLENIPFEAFNTNKEGLRYLIEKSNISYAYSMSFIEFNKKIKRKSKSTFMGFAPVNFQNKKLTSLTHTQNELNTIENFFDKSDTYFNAKATKENFLSVTTNSKIIHLATHAKTNPKPVIYFNKDSLNLHELYTYKNNADLVILSACETSLGEIKKGEGTLSLARGFFYSGTNAVISSLWNVNDASTTFLMKNFYRNLINNQSKSTALTNAKRKYLKEHSLSENSPYYWASFVLIGDTNPIFNSNYSIYYLFIFSFLIISFFIFLKKRG